LDVNGVARIGTTIYNSDSTLKKNIVALGVGNLSKLQQIRSVRYQLKTPSELHPNTKTTSLSDTTKSDAPVESETSDIYTKVHIGFIAQEVENVFPELVYHDKQGILSLNYDGLIPVMLQAMKEQQATIDALKASILDLQKRLNITTPSDTQVPIDSGTPTIQ
jgi:hypothetical protein